MAAVGGFKVPDFFAFLPAFQKPSHFQKADWRAKKAESFSKSRQSFGE
jgi:hypothetical protein